MLAVEEACELAQLALELRHLLELKEGALLEVAQLLAEAEGLRELNGYCEHREDLLCTMCTEDVQAVSLHKLEGATGKVTHVVRRNIQHARARNRVAPLYYL